MDGEWIDYNGYDWYLTGRTAPEVGATILIGYGLADEPVEQVGALRALAEVLRRELARPVETDPVWADPAERTSWSAGARDHGLGPVGYPQVRVDVSPSVTRISLRGDLATAEASMVRLARLFEIAELPRQTWLEVPEDAGWPGTEGHSWWEEPDSGRWLRDRVARSGVNAYSLEGSMVRASRLGSLLPGLMRHLSPAEGECRCVIVVDDRLLVGAGFTRSGPGSQRRPDPRPSEVDLGADPRHQAGSVRATNERDMLSVVAPYAPQSVAAFHLLADRVGRVVATRSEDCRLAFTMTPVERHLLLEVLIAGAPGQAVDGSLGGGVADVLSTEDYQQILSQVLRLDVPVTDTDVSWAMEKGRKWLGPLYEPMCHLAGVAPAPDLDPVSVRAAYRALASTIHLAVHAGAEPVEGYPLLVPDLPVRRGRTWHMWFEPGEEWSSLPRSVTLRDGVLSTWSRRPAGMIRYLSPPVRMATDLRRLAVLAHREPTGSYLLVDEAGRWVEVTPALFQNGASLRRRILRAGQGLPRTVLAWGEHTGARLERARGRARVRRRIYWAFMAVMAVFLCVVAGMAWHQERSGAVAGPGTGFLTMAVGETATLEDGTTVTVGDPRVETTPEGDYLYSYGVDLCVGSGVGGAGSGERGGGSQSEGAPEEAGAKPSGSSGGSGPQGRQVSARRFLLRYGDDLDWTATDPAADLGAELLADQLVPAGQCAAGRIGFQTDEEVSGAVVVMTDDVAGEVRWQEG